MATPPRSAVRLLQLSLPVDARDEIIGDLGEDFAELARTHGARAAARWYWRQALQFIWTLGQPAGRVGRRLMPGLRMNRVISWDDVCFAARRLLKHPVTSLLSVGILTCGLGGVMATWPLVSATLHA